jgi:hypothetical protein
MCLPFFFVCFNEYRECRPSSQYAAITNNNKLSVLLFTVLRKMKLAVWWVSNETKEVSGEEGNAGSLCPWVEQNALQVL